MDTAFFWASKLAWTFLSPDILLVLLLGLGLIRLYRRRYRAGIRLLSLSIFSVVILTILPVGDWLFYPLEKRFPFPGDLPESVDGIIVLGGAEQVYQSHLWHQVELNHRSERFFAFIHLMKKYPRAKHVFSGGTGSMLRQGYKGAEVAKRLFSEQGLDIDNIIFESQSKNTFENGVFTKKLLDPKSGERWILITSASHLPRAVGIFSKIGWKVIPYPVDHYTNPETLFRPTCNFSGNLDQFKWALREWLGLTAYYITGRTSRFFPGPCDL